MQNFKINADIIRDPIDGMPMVYSTDATMGVTPTGYLVVKPSANYLFTPMSINDNFPGAALLGETNRIFSNIKETYYRNYTRVNEPTGIYIMDCSGFMTYMLRYTLKNHFNIIDSEKTFGVERPAAADYAIFFNRQETTLTSTTGWMKIPDFTKAKPGDIVAYEYYDKSNNSGHAIILQEKPWKSSITYVIDTETCYQYITRIMDTSSIHKYKDSRLFYGTPFSPTDEKKGIGTGYMYFLINDSGQIKGHRYLYDATVHEEKLYSVGRAIPFATSPFKSILNLDKNLIIKKELHFTTKSDYINKPDEYYIFRGESLNENPPAIIYGEAERILDNMITSTSATSTYIEELTGTYTSNSTGIINYILNYTLPIHYQIADAAKIYGTTVPKNADYYQFFNSINSDLYDKNESPFGWTKIKYLRNAAPGDIIAWQYKDWDPESEDSSGHITIITSIPYATGNTETLGGQTVWEYEIIVFDLITGVTLHYRDSRDKSQYPDSTGSGVGTGTMYFYVDAAGEIKFSRWYNGATAYDHYFAIGRAMPFTTQSVLSIFDFN